MSFLVRLRQGNHLCFCVCFIACIVLVVFGKVGEYGKEEITPFQPERSGFIAYREEKGKTFEFPFDDTYYRWNAIRYCICSPTTRGWPSPQLPMVREYVKRLAVVHATDRHDLLRPSYERLAEYAALKISRTFGVEGLINLDAHLRKKIPRVMCAFDNDTMKNFGAFFPQDNFDEFPLIVTLKPCNVIKNENFSSSDNNVKQFLGNLNVVAIPIPTKKSVEVKNEL